MLACERREMPIFSLLLALATAPLTFPHYDVEARCKILSGQSAISPGNKISNFCIEQEQTYHDVAKLTWNQLSAKSQALCKSIADTTHGTQYSMLETCMAPRIEAERLQSPHHFHD
jgi:hypothetical protein